MAGGIRPRNRAPVERLFPSLVPARSIEATDDVVERAEVHALVVNGNPAHHDGPDPV